MRVFRWKALVPLLLLGAVGAGLWLLFADRIAQHTTESVGTTFIGARVEIDRLHLDVPHGRVEIRGLTVASPFEALQNLLQADLLVADLEPLLLLEKKLVIDRLAATVLLSGPGADFSGGEFVLTEQRPRMQSRAEVVPLKQGEAVIFPVHHRPVQGTRGVYRVNMRHGVSRVREGKRHTLGVIFHDAK